MFTAALFLLSGPLADLEGDWDGALQYRDYQSDKLVEIPMAVTGEMHGPVLIQKLSFTDPGFMVLRVSTTTYDAEEGKLFETYTQAGSSEHSISDVEVETTDNGWRMTAYRPGTDGGEPAMIKTFTELSGGSLAIERSYDPEGDGKEEYLFRNRIELQRR